MKPTYALMCSLATIVAVTLMQAGCREEPKQTPAKPSAPETKTTPAPKPAETATKPAKPTTTTAAITQKTCPVSGEPIDPKVWTEHEGKKIYFCCKDCIAKFKAEPAKYMAKLK